MEVDPSVTLSYWSVNPGFLQEGSSCAGFLARDAATKGGGRGRGRESEPGF